MQQELYSGLWYGGKIGRQKGAEGTREGEQPEARESAAGGEQLKGAFVSRLRLIRGRRQEANLDLVQAGDKLWEKQNKIKIHTRRHLRGVLGSQSGLQLDYQ